MPLFHSDRVWNTPRGNFHNRLMMPPRIPLDVRSLARSHTQSVIRTLALIVAQSENDGARVSAAGMLLDRGWGRAAQTIDSDSEIRVIIRHIVEGRDMPVTTIDQPALARPAEDGET